MHSVGDTSSMWDIQMYDVGVVRAIQTEYESHVLCAVCPECEMPTEGEAHVTDVFGV